MSMASCMINAKSLDPSLEVDAISNSTHILNWSPHLALHGKIPFEAWCGRKPNVTHFRVFGCPTLANRSSRGCKAQIPRPCTFIDYEDSVKAYRLLDPETHQIFVEKDVHFEESSPSLSSTPLCTSYRVETDSDFSDRASIDSDMWGSVNRCSEHSLYQYSLHAYIATVTGPTNQGTSSLLGPTSYLEDSIDDLPLLDVVASSSVVTRAASDSLSHSLHDRSSQVEVSVDTYDQ